MRILLINDDGIDAPGLAALESACAELANGGPHEVFVVAPQSQASQIGHRVTTGEPIRVEARGDGRFAVAGTPADCARLALANLMPQRPDLVLSGINAGGNLGQDIVISGTVAAAREAAYHGIPAMAFSHYLRAGVELSWEVAARRVAAILNSMLDVPLADGEYLNINLPHLDPGMPDPEVIHTTPERAPMLIGYDETPEGFRYNGRYADRPQRSASGDVAVCFGGSISVSRLRV
jgi:5'-nucleotidase